MNNIIKSGFPRIVCRLIMVLLLAGMCHYGTMANETLPKSTGIGEEYNPDSPGNPGENPEETEKTYRLTVVANPSGAGYVSAGSSELKPESEPIFIAAITAALNSRIVLLKAKKYPMLRLSNM